MKRGLKVMTLVAQRGLGWLGTIWANLNRSRTFGLAAEMSFFLFLSLLPLAAVAGLVAARLATQDNSLIDPLLTSLPPASRQLIVNELGRVSAWKGGAVGPLAIVTFVWLASAGVSSVFDALELETESPPRGWLRKRLLAIATCVALSVGVASLTLLSTGLGWVVRIFGGVAEEVLPGIGSTLFGTIVRVAVGAAIAVSLIAGLYYVGIPQAQRRTMPVWPGAILATGLQALLGWGYSAYIGRMGDGGAYQAGLAAIAVTLTALYLFSIALLVGAEVNGLLSGRALAQRVVDKRKKAEEHGEPIEPAVEGQVKASPAIPPLRRTSIA